jgi:hypothetical protein
MPSLRKVVVSFAGLSADAVADLRRRKPSLDVVE